MNLESLVTKDFLAARFAEQQSYIDTRFAEFESKFRTLYVLLGIIMAGVILPYFERLLAL